MSDAAIHDYFAKRGDAIQLSYNDLVNDLGIHDLNGMDYANSLTMDDIQSVGTAQAPKSAGQKPDPSIAQPNSYNANLKQVQQALDQMLVATESGYNPNKGFLLSSWGSSAFSTTATSNSTNFTQWLYNNQSNWEGQTALFLLQKAQQGSAI